MATFRKITRDNGQVAYINTDFIVSMARTGGQTYLYMGKREFIVKETPEEILGYYEEVNP